MSRIAIVLFFLMIFAPLVGLTYAESATHKHKFSNPLFDALVMASLFTIGLVRLYKAK